MNKSTSNIFCSFFIALLLNSALNAQVNENFTDGDFTNSPTWVGNTGDFIVNSNNQLQSNNTLASSTFYLSTASAIATGGQWEFYSQLAFSTSGANFVDVYLVSAQSDLTSAANTGYFVRIGNTDDEISLYRKDANGTSTKIIDGVNSSVGSSSNIMKIKVVRDAGNNWFLYRDMSGSGTNYFSEGTVMDATFTTSAFFGILIKQSTASFFQKHFFDDISVAPYTPDITPPTLVSATAATANTLAINFSEAVNTTSAQDINNYTVTGLGKPTSAVIDAVNPASVRLAFASNFVVSNNYTLTVSNVADLSGNVITTANASFTWFVAGKYSVVIDELMADPTPQVGLPNTEWLELKNTTPVPINLQGYKLAKASSISGAMPAYILQPDSFVVVTTSSQVAALSAFGPTISVTSFPSLGNDADLIMLQSASGVVMHTVNYDISWYQNGVKANGGWTLEMIDPKNACAGATNWRASVDSRGGTPGTKNSIDGANVDNTAPKLLRAMASDNVTLTLFFDEPLDSASASTAASYTVNNNIGAAVVAIAVGPLFNKVMITLNTPLVPGTIYAVSVQNVGDCAGNQITTASTAPLGLSSLAAPLDIVINEILFNPKDFGVDFVELYNRSNRIIDLSTITIANRSSSTGALGSLIQLTPDSYLLFPGAYVALTSDPSIVKQQYIAKDPDAFLTVSLPSFPDTKGFVVILDNQGNIVDELDYDYKWHFALVDDEEGISLERIDFEKPTNSASNWTSAASTAGFGTPGYQNSQYRADLVASGAISINPRMFSPDNDGYEDFAFINFNFPQAGYVVNINIYDAAGRPVRVLQRNTTAAATGSFRWDGLDDKQQKVPAGTYVILTEIFNLDGKKQQFKNAVVVAKKF